MINLEEFKKRVTIERFDNLVRTSGEAPAEVGNRVLRTAQNSIKAFCIKFGGTYDEADEIISDAVYGYAVGVLFNSQQLSQGNDEMNRAEKQIESLFAQSVNNPQNPNYGRGKISAHRIELDDD